MGNLRENLNERDSGKIITRVEEVKGAALVGQGSLRVMLPYMSRS